MCIRKIQTFYRLQDEGQSLLRMVISHLNLTAHGYHRILKLARSIADLAELEGIQSPQLADALQCCQKLMMSYKDKHIV